jgi:tetratricopeptide (TPR) repeat protein
MVTRTFYPTATQRERGSPGGHLCYDPSLMRSLVMRLSRILVVALLGSLAIAWARSHGMSWLGWAVVLALFVTVTVVGLGRSSLFSAEKRETQWEAALFEAKRRPRAIAQLRRALRRLTPIKQRTRSEHTRLSILLAELLDASGAYAEASAIVDELPLGTLTPVEAALVRHTRAVTHLRSGDPEGALTALHERGASGDLELDQRLGLLETYARLELGGAARALDDAAALEQASGVDQSVVLEARVVRAAALDALGRREEALVTLAALGRESLLPLAELGQPRVRALAKTVLEGYEN